MRIVPIRPDIGQRQAVQNDYGSAVLVGVVVDEIFSSASEDQGRGFFTAVGRRIAEGYPFTHEDSLDDIAQTINRLWEILGWGSVGLAVDVEGILVDHNGPPAPPEGVDLANWSHAIAAIFEGAYETWFRSVGGGVSLRTRTVRQSDDRIELRHGR